MEEQGDAIGEAGDIVLCEKTEEQQSETDVAPTVTEGALVRIEGGAIVDDMMLAESGDGLVGPE